jgi:hypothetical protein
LDLIFDKFPVIIGLFNVPSVVGLERLDTVADICNTVTVESCPKCPRSQSIIIPNLQGLIAAIAVYRVKQPLKLSPEEIRFLRKACEWTARELGEKLQIRSETISAGRMAQRQ